jgi:hypothetical protein
MYSKIKLIHSRTSTNIRTDTHSYKTQTQTWTTISAGIQPRTIFFSTSTGHKRDTAATKEKQHEHNNDESSPGLKKRLIAVKKKNFF